MAGNRISAVAGILNGTCNYILTQMREGGREFADVLADAQNLGYAEADPTSTSMASTRRTSWRSWRRWRSVGRWHSTRCTSREFAAFPRWTSLRERASVIASSCWASRGRPRRGSKRACTPAWCPQTAPIARVDGVFNAVVAEGDFVGRVMLEGRGAGAGPTASAVVADLIDIARNRMTPVWGAARSRCPPRRRCR